MSGDTRKRQTVPVMPFDALVWAVAVLTEREGAGRVLSALGVLIERERGVDDRIARELRRLRVELG